MTIQELEYAIKNYESYMWNARDYSMTPEEVHAIAEMFIEDIWREKVYGSSIGEKLSQLRKVENVCLYDNKKR